VTRVDAGLLANALVVLVIGYAALYGLGFARPRPGALWLVGLAYLVGWSLLGSVLSLGLILGLDARVRTVVVVTALCVIAGILLGRRTAGPAPSPRASERHPLALAAAGLGAAILLVACASALALSVKGAGYAEYIDNVTFWIPKAESIFYSRGLDPVALARLIHPEYPPLVPAMNAATFHFVGGFHPSLLPFQMTLLGIAFVLAVPALLDRYAPRWITLPTLALLVTTPWFWWRFQSPLADQPVAYTVATAALCCLIWLVEQRHAWLALAVVLLAAASLTKLEGSMLSLLMLVVVLAAGLVLHGRAGWRAAWLALAPAALLPWHFWLTHHGLPASAEDYDASDLLRPGLLADRIHRLDAAIRWMLESPFHQPQTAVLVVVTTLVLVVVAIRAPALTATAVAWFLLASAGLASVYWIGRLEIDFYLGTSMSRVGTSIIITAACVMPLLLGRALEPDPPADGAAATAAP
jgi:hypothetical protein